MSLPSVLITTDSGTEKFTVNIVAVIIRVGPLRDERGAHTNIRASMYVGLRAYSGCVCMHVPKHTITHVSASSRKPHSL